MIKSAKDDVKKAMAAVDQAQNKEDLNTALEKLKNHLNHPLVQNNLEPLEKTENNPVNDNPHNFDLYRDEVEQHVDVVLTETPQVQIVDENPFDIACKDPAERNNKIVSFVTDQEEDFE